MPGIVELKKIAKTRGIKYFSVMPKWMLLEVLGFAPLTHDPVNQTTLSIRNLANERKKRPPIVHNLPTSPSAKVELTDPTSGEILRFKSVYRAAKTLGVHDVRFYNYTRRARIGNIVYNVALRR